ncbi:MAG: hypothetical protein PHY02_10135 [Phycisphaerae bacterium]|nr:hypothetical protein [Phycisphaerae bacterium]
MEEGTKKIVMVVVILVCLIAAGTIYYINSSGGNSVPEVGEATVTIKCNSCGNEWQMDNREYLDYMITNQNRIGVVCPKCKKATGYSLKN